MESELVSNLPNVRNLIKSFESFQETLDNSLSDFGASHYKASRKNSLSLKKRDSRYQDLRSFFIQKQEQDVPDKKKMEKKDSSNKIAHETKKKEDEKQEEEEEEEKIVEPVPSAFSAMNYANKQKRLREARLKARQQRLQLENDQKAQEDDDEEDEEKQRQEFLEKFGPSATSSLNYAEKQKRLRESRLKLREQKKKEQEEKAKEIEDKQEDEDEDEDEDEHEDEHAGGDDDAKFVSMFGPSINSAVSYAARQSRLREARLRLKQQNKTEGDSKEEPPSIVTSAIAYANKQKRLREARMKAREQKQNEEKKKEEQDLKDHVFVIRNDQDVASILIDVIHGIFYDPETGFWSKYDAEFNRNLFVQPNWKNDPQARQSMEDKKNNEVQLLMRHPMIAKAINDVEISIATIVKGIERPIIKRAVENHIFDHLYNLIFEDQTSDEE